MSEDTARLERWLLGILGVIIVASLLAAGALALIFSPVPGHALARDLVDKLFALNTVQSFWYITRAAGLVAYLLLWLATAWGVAVSSKIFDPWLNRYFTYDFHQFLSLLALGFVAVHVLVLMGDRYLPYSLAQILVPFLSPYRPVWVGIGVISLYLSLLVSVTFYLRNRIGPDRFRAIHYVSYLAFAGSALHGLLAGTDSPLLVTRLMYVGTVLVVVFLTAYHIIMAIGASKAPAGTKPPLTDRPTGTPAR